MKSIDHLSKTHSLYGKYNNNSYKKQSQLVWYENIKPLQINVADSLNLLPETGQEILNHTVRKLSQYDIGCFSQATIARETGYSRKTVNKYFKIFHSLGLVLKQKRYKQTCLYKFSDHIFYEEVINLLTSVIGAFSELKEGWVTGIRNLYYISTDYLSSIPNFGETLSEVMSPFFLKRSSSNQTCTKDTNISTTELVPNVDIWKYFENDDPPNMRKLEDECHYYEKEWRCVDYYQS